MYKTLQLNRNGTAVDNPEDIGKFPPSHILSNEDLWQLELTPSNHATPQIVEYLEKAKREFYSRNIKLKPIMDYRRQV